MKTKPLSVSVPAAAVTFTAPLEPEPTTAVITESETVVNEVAAVAPNLTAVAPVKLYSLMVTTVPVVPWVGVNEVISVCVVAAL